jgi:hypothetical protein
MQTDTPEHSGTRAIALAGLAITQGIIGVLLKKGILNADQMNELFEIVLQSAEQFPRTDSGSDEARQLIDEIAKAAAKRFPRTDSRSPR